MDSSENRQLAAITFIDIADFSELMHHDESKAVHLLSLQKDIIYPIISIHNGKILKEMGDGLLVSFNSAIQAVQCSIEIQSKIEYIENLNYRIGIHVGDVIIIEKDVFGDGVNIASRIQEICKVGEVCISKTVYDAIINHPEMKCTSLGEKELKGISEKIELFTLETSNQYTKKVIIDNTKSIDNSSSNAKFWLVGLAVSVFIALSIIQYFNIYSENDGKISVAILPFGNTKQDEEFEYLSQQFVDELTPVLVKIPYLSIKDYSQVRKIFETIEPSKANVVDLSLVQKLGQLINAHYILYGNYAVIKEQIRITCNIADVKSGIIINSYKSSYNFFDLTKLLDSFPDSINALVQNSNLNKNRLINEK